MNDAVKPAVSDEMVELFGINFWPINAASKIDAQREHIRNALSAALAAQGQEPVAVKDTSVTISWFRCDDCNGTGLTLSVMGEPEDCALCSGVGRVVEQAASALTAPAQPVGVPEGWRLVPEKPTIEMVKKAHKDHEGEPWLPYSLWGSMLAAAPQPPAEGGWRDMATAPKGLPTEDVGCHGQSEWFLGRPAAKYRDAGAAPCVVIRRRPWPLDDGWSDNGETYYTPSYFDGWMPLPPAPANGGEQ